MSLKRRLAGVERRARFRPASSRAPSRTEIEAWELKEEIARLDAEIRAEKLNPEDIQSSDVPDGLTLYEEIEWLERELEAGS